MHIQDLVDVQTIIVGRRFVWQVLCYVWFLEPNGPACVLWSVLLVADAPAVPRSTPCLYRRMEGTITDDR